MRRSRSGALAVLVLVLLTSTSCAAQTDRPADSAKPRVASPSIGLAGCEGTGSGFALSLAKDKGGQSTPLAAVVHFGEHGGVPGYQAPAAEWVSAPSHTDSEGQDVDGVTLRTDHVFLHVIPLTDDSWAVDSGGHRDEQLTRLGRRPSDTACGGSTY